MSYISSKFNVPSYSNSGLTGQDYADWILTKLKDAFIATNDAWELATEIENIGTNTDTGYGCRTIQLKNADKYLRIWYFSGSTYATFVDSPTSSGGNQDLKIYKGNAMKVSLSIYGLDSVIFGSNKPELLFAVASHSIDADFGLDLDLDLPIFSIKQDSIDATAGYELSAYNSYLYGWGGIVSVVSDGSMFGVIVVAASNWQGCFYAPDMFVCANSSDTYTAGVMSTRANNNIYLGDNSTAASEYSICVFSQADGGFDFYGMSQGMDAGKRKLICSESSTKMVTGPVAVYMTPIEYSGSTATAVIDGVGLKGWLNTKYIRSANTNVLPYAQKGNTFASGSLLCVDAGTLICWDSSNSSPFEAAT